VLDRTVSGQGAKVDEKKKVPTTDAYLMISPSKEHCSRSLDKGLSSSMEIPTATLPIRSTKYQWVWSGL
jgi:hypothetical protein